jgi:hypothetical protein
MYSNKKIHSLFRDSVLCALLLLILSPIFLRWATVTPQETFLVESRNNIKVKASGDAFLLANN